MGITKEGAEIMTDYKGMPALDAGLAAAAQAVEHYEMSRYGTLRTWAEELGMPEAAALLEATLKEEKATDVGADRAGEVGRERRSRSRAVTQRTGPPTGGFVAGSPPQPLTASLASAPMIHGHSGGGDVAEADDRSD